ncbi:hypothetical protein SHIRM173S_13024 [Streptomyces hirsutus]
MSVVATATTVETGHAHPSVNRPNLTSVGTIIWLSSELMFFAALFAMYFTLRSVTGPDFWSEKAHSAELPVLGDEHHDPGALLTHLPARRLRRRAR